MFTTLAVHNPVIPQIHSGPSPYRGSLNQILDRGMFMLRQSIIAVALALGTQAALADTIVQWNFNSVPADSSTATGSTAASTGSGMASLIGGVTGAFGSGSANGGSSDPAATDNSGWQTTGYAAQGVGDLSRGAQFQTSTVGYENILFSYDLRHSNTSSRYEAVQYSLDGINFTTAATFDGNAGDTWFKGRTVDLTSFNDVVANVANLYLRVVATFAPGTTAYAPANAGSSYAGTGTWRFDMVTVSGSVIPAVPEPKNYAMLLAGLGMLGFIARRRFR